LDEELTTGAFAFLLRASALALRFALPLALIRLLGLEATGLFALITASAAIAPAAMGWGLNNRLTRDLVLQPDDAPRLIATRLAVTASSIMLAMIAAMVILGFIAIDPTWPVAPALALIALETLALDIHVILIALGRARRANLLLFLRSAAWIPIFLIAAWRFEALRSLDLALGCWIAGHLLALATFSPLLLGKSWRNIGIDAAWLRRGARDSVWIYAADLGLVGQLHADRYLVGALMGLEATAVYSICAAVGQSLQILASSAVVQPALPRLIATAGQQEAWPQFLRAACARLALLFILLLAIAIAAMMVLAQTVAIRMEGATTAALLLLSLASGVRSLSDAVNAVLIGQGRHRIYSALSLTGAALSLALCWMLLPILGLAGAGFAALGSAAAALAGHALALATFKSRLSR
jgi:O-antigen/teichoic acid export membrane protein